jgi:CPA1 family monovalent cation:H+ antiporter
MTIVYTTLILLLVVALSGVLLRLLPDKLPLPLPLVQIGLGAVLALPAFGLQVRFDPQLFFLLFIPPLLFADGWRIPNREFFQLRGPIFTLALGLVFFTVAGIGWLVHWLIPMIPLAAAFALAAVLSPTDALAITSITGNTRMPTRLLRVLEGEALMNDASGLVCLRFAVAAVLTGEFSWSAAIGRFLLIAIGGVAIGAAVTWLYSRLRRRLLRWSGGIDPSSQVALLLLLPFAAYLLAERAHVSGILAVVAAGMTMSYTDILGGNHATTRMQSSSVWGMVEFVFNGIIFLLLGLQLPSLIGNGERALTHAGVGSGSPWQLAGYVLAITLALALLRFVWVWVSLRVSYWIARWRGQSPHRASPSLIWVTALSGVRGAITLAAVLSIPLAMPNGQGFPARDLLVFLAASVILSTLLLGSIVLPLLLRHLQLPPEPVRGKEERLARQRTAQAALAAIERRLEELVAHDDAADRPLVQRIGKRISTGYQQRIEAAGEDSDALHQARQDAGIERELRLAALGGERRELSRMRRAGDIDDSLLRALTRELDLAEGSLSLLRRDAK